MKRHIIKGACVVIALVFVGCVGCATVPQTPQTQYFAALKHFNDTLEQYLDYYALGTPTAQAKWDQDITPMFVEGAKVLDAWGLALSIGKSPIDEQRLFTEVRRRIFMLMLEHGVLEVEP